MKAMDGARFDGFTRSLGRSGTRRGVLGGLVAAGAAVFGFGRLGGNGAEAAACRLDGQTCTKDAQCCSDLCGEPDRRGRRSCICPEGTEPCAEGCCVPPCGDGGPCLIFVTSGAIQGTLGPSLAAYDAFCQQSADNAGLPGTYKAWISAATDSAADRLVHSPTPYVRTDGVTVASNWDDLIDSQLSAPIQIDESGNDAGDRFVWTGTEPDGSYDTSDSCGSWVNVSGITSAGESNQTASVWTVATFEPCSNNHSLYCLQQTA
jgi:hypothetical protein